MLKLRKIDSILRRYTEPGLASKMSKQQVRVASLLLDEGFGSLVEQVGTHLLKHGASNLGEIVQGTGLKRNQVEKIGRRLPPQVQFSAQYPPIFNAE